MPIHAYPDSGDNIYLQPHQALSSWEPSWAVHGSPALHPECQAPCLDELSTIPSLNCSFPSNLVWSAHTPLTFWFLVPILVPDDLSPSLSTPFSQRQAEPLVTIPYHQMPPILYISCPLGQPQAMNIRRGHSAHNNKHSASSTAFRANMQMGTPSARDQKITSTKGAENIPRRA